MMYQQRQVKCDLPKGDPLLRAPLTCPEIAARTIQSLPGASVSLSHAPELICHHLSITCLCWVN